MNNTDRIEPTLLVETILTSLPDTQAIYLFGSYVDGTAQEQSDLDVAVLLPSYRALTIAHVLWWQLQEQLMDLVERPVDLINFYQASTVFQIQILRTGQRMVDFQRFTQQILGQQELF